jgi:hypothetical protein
MWRSRRRRSAPTQAARSGTPYGRAAWAPVPPAVPIGRPRQLVHVTAVVRIVVATTASHGARVGLADSAAGTPHQAGGQAPPTRVLKVWTRDSWPLRGSAGSADRSSHRDETRRPPVNERSETTRQEHPRRLPATARSVPNPKPTAARSGVPLAGRSQGDQGRAERRANQVGDGPAAEAHEAACAASAPFFEGRSRDCPYSRQRRWPGPSGLKNAPPAGASGSGMAAKPQGPAWVGGWCGSLVIPSALAPGQAERARPASPSGGTTAQGMTRPAGAVRSALDIDRCIAGRQNARYEREPKG